jgi:hypothetical protein
VLSIFSSTRLVDCRAHTPNVRRTVHWTALRVVDLVSTHRICGNAPRLSSAHTKNSHSCARSNQMRYHVTKVLPSLACYREPRYFYVLPKLATFKQDFYDNYPPANLTTLRALKRSSKEDIKFLRHQHLFLLHDEAITDSQW